MEKIDFITKIGREIVDILWEMFKGFLLWIPKFIAAVIILAIGIVIAKFVKKWLRKLLKKIHFDEYVEKFGINKFLNYVGISIHVRKLLVWVAYWTIILAFFQSAVDVLDTNVVSTFTALMFIFIPRLIIALIIMVLGSAVANLSSKEVAKLSNNYFYSKLVKVIILFLTVLTAAEQLGVNVTLITDNLSIIVAGIMLGLGLAFGLGGKDKAKAFLDRNFH